MPSTHIFVIHANYRGYLKSILIRAHFNGKVTKDIQGQKKKVILEFNGQLKMIRDNITIDVAIETIAT